MNNGIYGYLHSRGFIPGLPGVLAPDLSNGGVIRTPGGMTPSAVAPSIPQGMAPLQAPVAPPSYAPGGFLRGVDRVLGGPPMAGLTPQNATEARRMGLLNAGIGMLAGASHGNFADALVGGLSGGQAGYQQGIQAGYGQQGAAEEQRMFAELAPKPGETIQETYSRLQAMMSAAIQAGKPQVAQTIAGVLQTLPTLMKDTTKKVMMPWEKEGFATQGDYLKYLRAQTNATQRPFRPLSGTSGRGTPAYMGYLNNQIDDLRARISQARAAGTDLNQVDQWGRDLTDLMEERAQLAADLPGAPPKIKQQGIRTPFGMAYPSGK